MSLFFEEFHAHHINFSLIIIYFSSSSILLELILQNLFIVLIKYLQDKDK